MILQRFKMLYQSLDSSNINDLDTLYAKEIRFVDPFHQVDGLENLKAYFQELYANVDLIEFEFGEAVSDGENHSIQWTMTLAHKKLNGSKQYHVTGISFLSHNDAQQIVFHRDYFDAGEMLYEQLPVIGSLVKFIKKKV